MDPRVVYIVKHTQNHTVLDSSSSSFTDFGKIATQIYHKEPTESKRLTTETPLFCCIFNNDIW